MSFITDSEQRINEVGVILKDYRNINEDETIIVKDSLLTDRFEVDSYVDNTVLNIER
jgi:hypothetical protein